MRTNFEKCVLIPLVSNVEGGGGGGVVLVVDVVPGAGGRVAQGAGLIVPRLVAHRHRVPLHFAGPEVDKHQVEVQRHSLLTMNRTTILSNNLD